MSEPSLAAQRRAVIAMRSHGPLAALVPPLQIFDRNQRPEVFPCVIIGEAQTVGDDAQCVEASEVYLTIHVWTKEDGMVACKSIAGEIRRALRNLTAKQDGLDLSFSFDDARFMRDPGGELSHGVVTMRVQAWELMGL